jgi:hypothetical protein
VTSDDGVRRAVCVVSESHSDRTIGFGSSKRSSPKFLGFECVVLRRGGTRAVADISVFVVTMSSGIPVLRQTG